MAPVLGCDSMLHAYLTKLFRKVTAKIKNSWRGLYRSLSLLSLKSLRLSIQQIGNLVSICPNCETRIPSSDTNGLCPKCLLAEGLSADDEAPESDDALTLASTPVPHLVSSDDKFAPIEFGDYELIEEIARGGMGVVYKARDRNLNRVVALKMILSGQLASSNDIRRFQQEAEAAANLDHSGIVPIYEVGEHGGQHFFSMKLLEGGSLADQLKELRQDTRKVVQLIADIARAVHYAHQRGILHRDLKPANILLDDAGNPMITDLGLAKDVGSQSDLTHTGAVVGTPSYMPPEQAAGERDITTAADIYAIGAVLYEALAGQPPHSGESPMAILMKVINDEPTPPRELNSKINRTLELICMKCLERDPNNRYSSAGALADDLESWLAGAPVSVRPPSISRVISDTLRTYLRSAFGAAGLGIIIGLVAGLGMLATSPGWTSLDEQAFSMYEDVTGESVNRWLFQLLSQNRNPGLVLSLLSFVFVGLLIQLLIRPKTKEHAFALGSVSGLTMTIAFFVSCAGLFGVSIGMDRTVTLATSLQHHVTAATLDKKGEEGNSAPPGKSEDQLPTVKADETEMPNYAAINEANEQDRDELIEKVSMLDAVRSITHGILAGVLASAMLCITCCVGGSIFANKLQAEQMGVWRMLLPQAEVGVLFFCLAVFLYGGEVNPRFRTTINEVTFSPLLWRLLSYVLVGVPLFVAFKRKPWYFRWAVYAVAFGLWIVV